MKTIGLLGGMSWESTTGYYKAINEGVKNALGGMHSARIAMYSVDFAEIEKMQHAGDWDGTARVLVDSARAVEAAGADFLLICTNTMHIVAPQIEQALDIPVLHIADATAAVVNDMGFETVGLLGTAFTMEKDFYKGRLEKEHGIRVIIPDEADRCIVHDVIYKELVLGRFEQEARAEYLRIIDALASRGAQAVILGCTEIGMLVRQSDTRIPLLDTTAIHAQAAVNASINAIHNL